MERDAKKRKLQEFHKEKSTLTEKIVSLWKSGSESGATCIASVAENKDIVKLQEFETKYEEADKIIQSIKRKFTVSEENVTRLNILLKKETTDKQHLLNKISTTWELIANISQHVNCITENLDRFQVQITNLSNKYDNIVLKLRSDKTVLHTEIKQLLNGHQIAVEEMQQKINYKEIEFNDLKVRNEVLEAQLSHEKTETYKMTKELENCRKKLMETEAMERTMSVSITELQEILSIERCKLERINATEEENLNAMRNNYELKVFELHKKYEETDKQLQEVENHRAEILKSLEEKKNSIASQEQEISLYQKQVRELMCQLTETGLNFQQLKDEKAHLVKKMGAMDIELSRLRRELDTITLENSLLAKERETFEDKLEEGQKERMQLTEDLTMSKKQLQEIMKHNNDMSERLHRDNEHKDCEIEKLRLQVQVLKQNSDQVLIEKIAEYQDRNKQLELEFEREIKIQTEKYKKSLEEVDKLSDMIGYMKKEDSFIKSALSNVTMEKEELKDFFCREKSTLEAKIFDSEKLITQKIENEKELGEKISKLYMNLAVAEKKWKDLHSAKDSKIMPLERKLSNLGLSTASQSPTSFQMQNTVKNMKNIYIKSDKMIASGKIKSILKPLVTLNSPNLSPKRSSKKISFNFGSGSSDDVSDFDHRSVISSRNDKFDDLMNKELHSTQMQSSLSQTSNSGTPSKSKKFFKSRGNL